MQYEAQIRNSRILVVDCDVATASLLANVLNRLAFKQVKTLTDPTIAFETVEQWKPDLLVLDLAKFQTEGFQLLEVLRSREAKEESVPVLVLTAETDPGTKRRALVSGVTDFLTKPFDSSEVVLRIRNLLHTRTLQQELRDQNRLLEERVAARTQSLSQRTTELEHALSELARAEREFQQAQKMEALGKLSGSIAHDFNNLLTVIIGGVECAQQRLPVGHPALSALESVQSAAERAAGLTRPLLTFSRNQVLRVELVDVNQVTEEAISMLHRLLGVNIEVRLNPGLDLRPIKANANQIHQVLMNLAVNARDAMDGVGLITITTTEVTIDPATAVRRGGMAAEDWIELAVSDSGCGMDAETTARIFEPFFTTKPIGKGTGLGLSTVFGIVKQTGGFIGVESAPFEGTTFRVFLPAATDADLAAVQQTLEPVPVVRNAPANEMLLLVDDEEEIRGLATMMLEGKGYIVLPAADAEEAILLSEKYGNQIQLLITDVMMPGINGMQLAEVLSKRIPGLRVLFVSGHSNEIISAEALLATRSGYLQKPYRGEALAAKVNAMLSEDVACGVSADEVEQIGFA